MLLERTRMHSHLLDTDISEDFSSFNAIIVTLVCTFEKFIFAISPVWTPLDVESQTGEGSYIVKIHTYFPQNMQL